MIIFFTMRAHTYTVEGFIRVWATALAQRVHILPYEDLAERSWLPPATYIFADLERLSPPLADLAADVWDQLAASGGSLLLYNHPRRTPRRYELQRILYEHGINRFAVHRLTEPSGAWKFPVFLRCESRHSGNLTPLLHTEDKVRFAAANQAKRGFDPADILVVEFCDTSDADGYYRKYSVLRVGDRYLPRHMHYSRNWMLKFPDLITPETLAEEYRYVMQNPHQERIHEIFQISGIDYGRIDYSLLGEEIQVWEINTNPVLIRTPDCYEPEQLPIHGHFARAVRAAYEAIDHTASGEGQWIPIRIRPEVIRRLCPPPVARLHRVLRRWSGRGGPRQRL